MRHKPSGLLGNAKVLGQLNGRNALAGIGKQIDRHKPLAEGQLALAKDGIGADGEVLLAPGATVTLAIGKEVNLAVAAMGAVFAISKTGCREVLDASFLVTEEIGELREGFELELIAHYGSKLPYKSRVVKCRNEDFLNYF